MTITNKTLHILSVSLIVGLIVLWRCERQNAIEISKQESRKQLENEILWEEIEGLKKINNERNKENIILRDSIKMFHGYFDTMSKENLWTEFRHYMRKR